MSEVVYKTCTSCKKEKSLDEFSYHKKGKHQRYAYCKICAIEKRREFIKNNPERESANKRRWRLTSQYGITPEEYQKLYEGQDGKCAICHRSAPLIPGANGQGSLHVDHDHETNFNRGLLYHFCNRLLGLAKDDPDILESAANYIRETQRVQKLMVLIG